MARATGDHGDQPVRRRRPAPGAPDRGEAPCRDAWHSVTSADGTSIGLLTAGTGPGLLLVHGGMGRLERWEPLWGLLTEHWQVTAMDRRGRGSSGDAEPYDLSQEYDDVAAVAASLADRDGARQSCSRTATARSARWARRPGAPPCGVLR